MLAVGHLRNGENKFLFAGPTHPLVARLAGQVFQLALAAWAAEIVYRLFLGLARANEKERPDAQACRNADH